MSCFDQTSRQEIQDKGFYLPALRVEWSVGALDTRARPRRWPHHQVQSSRVSPALSALRKVPLNVDAGAIAYSAPWIECVHGQRLDGDTSRQEHTAAPGAMGPAECMGSYPILGLSLYFSYSTFMCKVELEENATDHGVP